MRLNIQTKLLTILLGIGVPTLIVMGILGYVNGNRTIRKFVEEGLVAANSTKARHVESYFADLRSDVQVVAADRTVITALKEFAAASARADRDAEDPAALWTFFAESYPAESGQRATEPADTPGARRLQELYVERNPYPLQGSARDAFPGIDGSKYTSVHREYHDYLRRVRNADGLNNLMLVDGATRRIVYAVRKHADFQASLDGPLLQGTNLRRSVERALGGETNFVDFQRFAPAFDLPVAYLSSPIVDGGRVIGCVVAQIRIQELNQILSNDQRWAEGGLGTLGDTYIVGQDRTMRNDSRTLRERPEQLEETLRARGVSPQAIEYIRTKKTTVLAYAIDTAPVRAVLDGKTGFEETVGFSGNSIFAAYQPLQIEGVKWGILSRRDTAETLAPLRDFRRNAILTALGVLVLIAGVAAGLAKSFVAPIEAMSAAARRFGQGERGIRLAEAHRDDEFGDLARQFNTMVESSDRQERIQGAIRRNIVHDLKTPVTVIKGMGETLMFPEMAEDRTWREEMVKAIVEQSDRLLDDLKDILQPIDGAYVPEVEEFDIALLIERIVKAEKHTTRAADHIVVTSGTNSPVPISADRRKVRRVFENLLSNAIKYSPGSDKRVEIVLGRNEGGEITVAFHDQGLGLSPEELDRVLSKGGRITNHVEMGIEGSGFGLGSVQTVLKAHGGRLEVKSEPNRGSTFTAILPSRVPTMMTGPGQGQGPASLFG